MHDIDVRLAIRRHLESAHDGDQDTRIIEEMGIWAGSVRVDVAVINGEFHGIELKSARDTLDRLPRQATLYDEVFDRVTLGSSDELPEHDSNSGEQYEASVVCEELVVSGCDAPELLQFIEETLDEIALLVERLVVGERRAAIGF